jgi:hypothetical protein
LLVQLTRHTAGWVILLPQNSRHDGKKLPLKLKSTAMAKRFLANKY